MSRSGYSEDCENDWSLICWRGAVTSAIRGRRGQSFLREMLAALDVIPSKQLISIELETLEGCCALGAVARSRRLDVSDVDPEDHDTVARVFGVANALAREIMFENDEGGFYPETPEQRWQRVRRWVEDNIK